MDVTGVNDHRFARYFSVDEQLLQEPFPVKELRPAILPSHPRLQFGRFYRPGQAGTDFHDVMNLGGNRFAIAMADVSGPGAAAAAAMIRTTVRGHARRDEDSASLLHHINEDFRHLWHDGVFATGICAVVDTRRRTLRVASAGHPAPLLARQRAAVMPLLVHRTMPLGNIGLIVTSEYELHSGDRLLFYTDGVTDHASGENGRYDINRLASALQEVREFPPAVAVDCLANDIERFAGGDEPHDDQTLLLLEFDRRSAAA
jgi:phosphoserine phosphatase RsbU/P